MKIFMRQSLHNTFETSISKQLACLMVGDLGPVLIGRWPGVPIGGYRA